MTGGASLITGGKLVPGAGSELILQVDSASRLLTIASAITGGAALTKSGGGTLRLAGNNNYTGATTLLSGILQVSGGNAMPDASPVVLGRDHSSIFELVNNETIGPLSGGDLNFSLGAVAEVRLNSNTLTVNQTANTTFSGYLTGNAFIFNVGISSFVKTGAGDLRLDTGTQGSYSGTLIVNQGLFSLSGSTRLSSVQGITVNKASLLIDGSGSSATADHILDPASLTLNSADGSWSGETKPSGLAVRRVGLLRVEASSVLDFGNGSSLLMFAGLGNHVAGATLSITNWSNGSDRLIFAGNDDGRNAFQSAFAPGDISFNGYFGFDTRQLDNARFEVIPEPSAGLLVLAALSFFGIRRPSHRAGHGRAGAERGRHHLRRPLA